MTATLFSSVSAAKNAVQAYRNRTKEADEIYKAIKSDRRMSEFAKTEAYDKKEASIKQAEKVLRESLRTYRQALYTCESERSRPEILSRENLQLLDTLERIDCCPDDYAKLANAAAKEGNLTMCKALQKSAKAQGITIQGFDNPMANVDKMDSLIKAVERYLKSPDGMSDIGLDMAIDNMLASCDPTAPRSQIEVFYTPHGIDEELARDIRKEFEQNNRMTSEQQKAFLNGVGMDSAESDLEAKAQAMVDVSNFMKEQAAPAVGE